MKRGRAAKAARLAESTNVKDAEIVRVTMSMTRSQHRLLKRYAFNHDTSVSGLVQEWIDKYCGDKETDG